MSPSVLDFLVHIERFISYRILQITQPSQYRCTQLQYGYAVTSEAPSRLVMNLNGDLKIREIV